VLRFAKHSHPTRETDFCDEVAAERTAAQSHIDGLWICRGPRRADIDQIVGAILDLVYRGSGSGLNKESLISATPNSRLIRMAR
jgi:hypothetical protein